MLQLAGPIRKLVRCPRSLGLRAPARLWLLGVAFAAALVGAARSEEDESASVASIGLCIRSQTRVRGKICLEPPYEVTDTYLLLTDRVGVSVATNVPDWGLAVKLSAPDGGAADPAGRTVLCFLRDATGAVISQAEIGAGGAYLGGNGRCGSHEVYLEVVDAAPDTSTARPQGWVVDVRGVGAGAER